MDLEDAVWEVVGSCKRVESTRESSWVEDESWRSRSGPALEVLVRV